MKKSKSNLYLFLESFLEILVVCFVLGVLLFPCFMYMFTLNDRWLLGLFVTVPLVLTVLRYAEKVEK